MHSLKTLKKNKIHIKLLYFLMHLGTMTFGDGARSEKQKLKYLLHINNSKAYIYSKIIAYIMKKNLQYEFYRQSCHRLRV